MITDQSKLQFYYEDRVVNAFKKHDDLYVFWSKRQVMQDGRYCYYQHKVMSAMLSVPTGLTFPIWKSFEHIC